MSSAIVLGGYGTFGALVARDLAEAGISLTIAGRDLARARRMASELGSSHRAAAADVTRLASCRPAVRSHRLAVHAAGPFAGAPASLLEACLAEDCHYVDIAEDRAYVALARSYGDRFEAKGLTAAYGCSSLPGLSAALARLLQTRTGGRFRRARVTLFIGSRNPKGHAAVASFVSQLGRSRPRPERLELPAPYGARRVLAFESADADIFPERLGIPRVEVKVAFESRLATALFGFLARLPFRYGGRTAKALGFLARWAPRSGTSGGAVMTELFDAEGRTVRAALVAEGDGQRLAAAPCSIAVRELLAGGNSTPAGALALFEIVSPEALVSRMMEKGFRLHVSGVPDEFPARA